MIGGAAVERSGMTGLYRRNLRALGQFQGFTKLSRA